MDALDLHLASRLAEAKKQLVEVAGSPSCPHCDRPYPGEWVTVYDLKRAVYKRPEWKAGESGTIGCAVHELVADGVLEVRNDLKVRLKP